MSDHDALDEEAAIALSRLRTDMFECICGQEYEDPQGTDVGLKSCPSCDQESCIECRHQCDREAIAKLRAAVAKATVDEELEH